MRPAPALLLAIALALPCRCGSPAPRSPYSFDQIQQRVTGKSAREIEALLGKPDTRQRLPTDDEKWIWWNYTVLDGEPYAPEVRRRIVHLEILLECRSSTPGTTVSRHCSVLDPTVVSYSRPAARD